MYCCVAFSRGRSPGRAWSSSWKRIHPNLVVADPFEDEGIFSAAGTTRSSLIDGATGTVFMNRCDYIYPELAWAGVPAWADSDLRL
jgi:hypothetical protein